MEFVKEWIARRLTELGYEDDVITNYIYALLESEVRYAYSFLFNIGSCL